MKKAQKVISFALALAIVIATAINCPLSTKNGRASNLKEALNLFEEQLHRWQMEGYQQQILQSTQQQLFVSQKLLRRMW